MDFKIGIIGGTGLENVFEPEMTDVEHVAVETEHGNPSDTILTGRLDGIEICVLPRHGRTHDKIPTTVNYAANILALSKLGCKIVLSISAVGSLQAEYRPGELCIVSDAIDRTTRFPRSIYDGIAKRKVVHMSPVPLVNQDLRDLLVNNLCDLEKGSFRKNFMHSKVHHHGTVVVIEGPRYSTRAESLMYRGWGAELIGMTLFPECIMAKEAGVAYACIALVTDYDAWKEDSENVTSAAVIDVMRRNSINCIRALKKVLPLIKAKNWTQTFDEIDEGLKDALG